MRGHRLDRLALGASMRRIIAGIVIGVLAALGLAACEGSALHQAAAHHGPHRETCWATAANDHGRFDSASGDQGPLVTRVTWSCRTPSTYLERALARSSKVQFICQFRAPASNAIYTIWATRTDLDANHICSTLQGTPDFTWG